MQLTRNAEILYSLRRNPRGGKTNDLRHELVKKKNPTNKKGATNLYADIFEAKSLSRFIDERQQRSHRQRRRQQRQRQRQRRSRQLFLCFSSLLLALRTVRVVFAFRFVAFWVNSLAYVSLATRPRHTDSLPSRQAGRETRQRVGRDDAESRPRPALQCRKFVFGMRMRRTKQKFVGEHIEIGSRSDLRPGLDREEQLVRLE